MTERTGGEVPQLQAYENFKTQGLNSLFNEFFPVYDFVTKEAELRYTSHRFGDSFQAEEESQESKSTYSAPLIVDFEYKARETTETREQEIFICRFPLMTARGTFIVNGTEYQSLSNTAEIFEDQLRIGIRRMAHATRSLMAKTDSEIATPASLLSRRPVVGAIRQSLQKITASQ